MPYHYVQILFLFNGTGAENLSNMCWEIIVLSYRVLCKKILCPYNRSMSKKHPQGGKMLNAKFEK